MADDDIDYAWAHCPDCKLMWKSEDVPHDCCCTKCHDGIIDGRMEGAEVVSPAAAPQAVLDSSFVSASPLEKQAELCVGNSPQAVLECSFVTASALEKTPAAAEAPAALKCACGLALGEHEKFCSSCGRPQPAPPPPQSGWTCSCGENLQDTAKFCASCGQPRPAPPPPPLVCRCGAALAETTKFCPSCGHSQSEKAHKEKQHQDHDEHKEKKEKKEKKEHHHHDHQDHHKKDEAPQATVLDIVLTPEQTAAAYKKMWEADPEQTAAASSPQAANAAFAPGVQVRTLNPTVVRELEELASTELGQLPEGAVCRVQALGVGETGRRLMIVSDEITGWISCAAQSGRPLIETVLSVSAPEGLEAARKLPPSHEAATPTKPCAIFGIGSEVVAVDKMLMRSGEDLASSVTRELEGGQRLIVCAHGLERRLVVEVLPTEACHRDGDVKETGWISCMSQSGRELIQSVPSEAVVGKGGGHNEVFPVEKTEKKEHHHHPSFTPTPGFTSGPWDFICVNPAGAAVNEELSSIQPPEKKGTMSSLWSTDNRQAASANGLGLQHGELVCVRERGLQSNITCLGLADGRGWTTERITERNMAEVFYEEIPADQQGKVLVVTPELGCGLPLTPTPYKPEKQTLGNFPFRIFAGTFVSVKRRARVTLHCPTDKKKDVPGIFLLVADEEEHEGWIPETAWVNNDRYLVDFTTEPVSQPSNWISVMPNCTPTAYGVPGFPASGVGTSRKLAAGELLEVTDQFIAKYLRFFRLAGDGLWVCEKPSGAKSNVVELVSIEQHYVGYLCNDKDGAHQRDSPTRHSSKNEAKVKHRQRVVSTDIAKFPSGDAFIHIAVPHPGWIPMTKVSGGQKMQALTEVAPIPGGFLAGRLPALPAPPVVPRPKVKVKAKPKPKGGNSGMEQVPYPSGPVPMTGDFGIATPSIGSASASNNQPRMMPMPVGGAPSGYMGMPPPSMSVPYSGVPPPPAGLINQVTGGQPFTMISAQVVPRPENGAMVFDGGRPPQSVGMAMPGMPPPSGMMGMPPGGMHLAPPGGMGMPPQGYGAQPQYPGRPPGSDFGI